MALTAIAAAGAIASAASGIYAAASSGGANPATAGYAKNLQQQQANADYVRLLNTIGLQRSSAGTSDDQGSSTYYDPATNTWKSKLGAVPLAAQNASYNASISRNTTDMRMAQAVNELAAKRASEAAPGADEARRELEQFRPQTSNDVTSALVRNIVDATNQTNRPAVQDMLRNFTRTGTAADSQVEAFGRQNADNVRKSVIDATIAGKQGVGQINAGNLGPLTSRYSTLAAGTTPNLQYSQTDSNDPNKALQALIASRSQAAASAPFAGMTGLAQTGYTQNQAAQLLGGSIAPDNTGAKVAAIGKQFSNLTKDTDFTSGLKALGFGDKATALPSNPNFDLSKGGSYDPTTGLSYANLFKQ